MPKHARCAVGFCDNDARYPDLCTVRSYVKDLKFHRWPKDPELAEIWRKQVAKGRKDHFNPSPGSSGTFVCSLHFPRGERTPGKRETDYPTLFLTTTEFLQKQSPKTRKNNERNKESTSLAVDVSDSESQDYLDLSLRISMRFAQFSREFEVRKHTGLPSTEAFKCLFQYLMPKAQRMQYWRGVKQTRKETPKEGPEDPYFESKG
jgi:hypothetical protein